jgi:hypothetical protein
MFLAAGQEKHLPRTEFLRPAESGEGGTSFQTLDRNLTRHFMGREFFASWHDQADDLQVSSLDQGRRHGIVELCTQRVKLDYLARRGMWDSHCCHLLFGLMMEKLLALLGFKAGRPSPAYGQQPLR